jgi:transcriptional regulatory protein LevR
MPFEERFRLLIVSGQASESSIAATRKVLEQVEAHYRIELTEELGASLASHLGITLRRLLSGESLTQVPDVVWQELKACPEELGLAKSIVADLERDLDLSIARDEVGFIAVHLCKIRSRSGSVQGGKEN